MKTLKNLVEETNVFFNRHWTPILKEYLKPAWSEPWRFIGPWHNHQQQGAYSFFIKDEVVYIGVAASHVGGSYKYFGLANRSSSYLRVEDKQANRYQFIEPWKEIEEVRTIGFVSEISYLAYSLEIFLIRKLEPSMNIKMKKH